MVSSTGSPRPRRTARRPPAVSARRTSFTVAPCACATALTSSRVVRITARLRSGPTIRSRLVRVAGSSARSSRIAGQASRACRSVVPGRMSIDPARLTSRRCRWTLSLNRSRSDGGGVGVHGDAGVTGAPGSASRKAATVVIAAMPSAIEWCSFTNMATRPPGSPGMNHIRQSGRDGSNRSLRSSSATARRPGSSVSGGSGRTTTWSRTSKRGASTQSGPPSPRRGTWMTCRNRGTRCSLDAIASRMASIRSSPAGSRRLVPSRIARAPMSCGQRLLAPNISRSSEVSLSIDVLIVLTSDRSA